MPSMRITTTIIIMMMMAAAIMIKEVKLFLSEDYPSKVGQKSEDHLQAKTTSMLHSNVNESNDLPPGFESSHFLNQSKVEFSHISLIKWECPPWFVFSSQWRVAAGEESKEKENQKLREMRVLEAVYPRLSAIPPSPSVSLDVEEEDYDDTITPLIPIIPIEEEESMDILPECTAAVNPSTIVQLQNLQQHISAKTPISSDCNTSHTVSSDASLMPFAGASAGSEADLGAASAVVAAIMKNNEQGSLIDMDLLVKIFNDPKMIEKLINEHRSASSHTVALPTSRLKATIPSCMFSTSTSDMAISGIKLSSTMKPATPSVSLLTPTPDKPVTLSAPAIPSVSMVTSANNNLAAASVPLSRSVSGKPVSPTVPMGSTPTPARHMLRPVNKNIHHMSNGMPTALNTQPQQDTVMASGVKRAASLASFSSSELCSVPLPSATRNSHTVVNQAQTTATTMPYQLRAGSASAIKDANYYKNLIRQHGADKQDKQNSQIGIPHSNFQNLNLVPNIKQGEVKHKIQKPCMYFKGSKGCRNGSDCPYLHDESDQWGTGLGVQNAKRMKLGS